MIFGVILHLIETRVETRVTYTYLPCVLDASAIVFAFKKRPSFVNQDKCLTNTFYFSKISIRNNAALIYGTNVQNTTSTSATNDNVINGVTILISEKFKGSCEWYFKSDIAEFEFDYANSIKLKTFINKICNLTKFSIFFSFSFKPLMTWSVLLKGRKDWRVWLKDLFLTQIYWLVIDY